jgi:hypothetical protein
LTTIVSEREDSVTALLGSPGSGKSALLARLGTKLKQEGIVLLALKADLMVTVQVPTVGVVLSRWRRSVRSAATTPGVAEALPPVFDAIGFEAIVPTTSFLYRVPEHLVMPLETLDVIGCLKKEAKQIQESGRILGLWVERVEVRPLHLDGITGGPAPFPVEIQTLPAVADSSPDLAPSGLRPQHINHHPSAVTAGLIAI